MRAVCPAIRNIRSDERKEVAYVTMQMLMADERRAAREEGIREGTIASISSLMENMGWSVEQAMEALGIPNDKRAQYAALLRER